MKNILIGVGKIAIFIMGLSVLVILIRKLLIDFPNIDAVILMYFCIIGSGLIILVMPEIKKLFLFGSGVEFKDTVSGPTGSTNISSQK